MGTGNYIGTAIFSDNIAPVTATWTSATAQNTALSISTQGYGVAEASVVISGSITGGVLSFEVSDDNGTTWFPIIGVQTGNFATNSQFPLNGASNTAWSFSIGAFSNFRVRLSTAITGTGSIVVTTQAESMALPTIMVVGQSAGSNLVISGTVTVQQPTAGNLNATVVFGSPQHVIVDSGTVAATQSGTWNIGTLTSITNAVTVTGTVAATQSGTWTVTQSGNWTSRIVGNAGATLDSTIGAGTAPTNMVVVGGQFRSALQTLTNLQTSAIALDAKAQVFTDLNYVAGNPVTVSTTGMQKVGIAGGAGGATIDAAIGAATAPTNMIAVGGVYNSTLPTLSTGQSAAIQVDAKGQQLIDLNYVAGSAVATAATGIVKVGLTDGSGNAITSTSSALDINVKSSALTDPAEVAPGTIAPTKIVVIGGKSNDIPAQYQPLPMGASGRSVIIEGYSGGTGVPAVVYGPDALGATPTKNPVQLSGLDYNGKVRALQTDYQGNLLLGISRGAASDAFGRLRTSQPFGIFNTSFQYDAQPLLFLQSVSGTGSIAKTANESSVTLSTGGTASGASAIFQTKEYFRYQPGKSQFIMMTGVMGAKKANVRQRIGYFDANDGVFFQQDGTNLSVVVRSSTSGSPVDTVINQSSWNIDKLDGTGPSGITLDTSSTQIFMIDLQWLGVGRVRYAFNIDGLVIPCHFEEHANLGMTSPYMNTACLPVRYEISNTGTAASTTTMKAICSAVMSEGSQEGLSIAQRTATNGATLIPVTTRRPILSMGPKTTFNSISNRGLISIGTTSIYADSPVFFEIVINGTLTGVSWTSVGTNSIANYDTSATAISGGTVAASGYIGTSKQGTGVVFDSPLPIQAVLGLDIAGVNADNVSVVVTSLSGTSNCGASIIWVETK